MMFWRSAGNSDCRARISRRPGSYRPQLLVLEDRCAPGDVLSWWSLFGEMASLWLNPGSFASENGFANGPREDYAEHGRPSPLTLASMRSLANVRHHVLARWGKDDPLLRSPAIPLFQMTDTLAEAPASPASVESPLLVDPTALKVRGDFTSHGVADSGLTQVRSKVLPSSADSSSAADWRTEDLIESREVVSGGPPSSGRIRAPLGTARSGTIPVGPAGRKPCQEWVARYNGPVNSGDEPTAIAVDAAGNVYVTGSVCAGVQCDEKTGDCQCVNHDYGTVKYDAAGHQLWAARYGGGRNDNARAMAVDAAGNVYVTGESQVSATNSDYATVKYDASGNQLWAVRYNGPANRNDGAKALAIDTDGNVYVTGHSEGAGTGYDYATIKYDVDGRPLWVVRYNGPGNGADEAVGLALDAAGNVYVTGSSPGTGTGADYATVKYDADGKELWVGRYNGPANLNDSPRAIAVDAAGNAYVTGASGRVGFSTDYATVKYDVDGKQIWVARYSDPTGVADRGNAIALDVEGNVYVTGISINFVTFGDYATIKYSQTC